MSPEAADWWARAIRVLETARREQTLDPDTAASRAYYAAFYAVTALFALEGRTYSKHSAVREAVHRDLVKPGRWSRDLGSAFDDLRHLRAVGDYGGGAHVTAPEAALAIEKAETLLQAIQALRPEDFGPVGGLLDNGPGGAGSA